MNGACIRKIEVCLPRKVLDNVELESIYEGWSAEKIEKKTGIRSRHVAGAHETAVDLAYGAAKRLLDSLESRERNSVDFLLLCTQSPDYYLPPGSCMLQDRLGLPHSTGALDYNLGCSGFIYGLAMARGLIRSGTASSVLLITSETYTRHIHAMDRSNRTIFGDAAAATLVCASESDCILEFALGTDGSGYQNLIVPAGGLRKRYNPMAGTAEDPPGSLRTENDLYMNGPEVFNFTIEAVPEVIRQCMEKNRSALDQMDYVIFHQANKYMLNHLRKKMDIPEEKYYMHMLDVGNTVSATIPIALKDSLERGLVRPGNQVLLVGFGVGYSWGATVVKIKD
ncbi:ketoacyl-ACP synthase III [bacterium]|nr:ketoacyl-ACP synthase III [bacterium]